MNPKVCVLILKWLSYLLMIVAWVFGIALAPGLWFGLLAFALPPYAWVSLARAVLQYIGLLL
jgi:hypothetical protein